MHCTPCGLLSCRLFLLGRDMLPGGLRFDCMLEDTLPGGDLPCVHECLLCRRCQKHRGEIPGMLSMPEQRDNRISAVFPGHFPEAENEQSAHELLSVVHC